MRSMGLFKNYVVGIYDDSASIFDKEKAHKYKELTEFFTRFKYFGPILSGANINEVLNKAVAHENNYDYCLIQSVGHFIKEVDFFKFIEDWIEKQDFFITGHIIDKKEGYYGLHKQCLLVNLKYYNQFGQPEFGIANNEKQKVIKAHRSSKDIHDDYTPLWLGPTKDTQICTPVVNGWNFINSSLLNGLTVYNFHPKIRESKQYTYPNKNIEELRNQLQWIGRILDYAPASVFFWNTENYTDIMKTEIPGKVSILYSVASSFKPNMFLHKYDFHDNTIFVLS